MSGSRLPPLRPLATTPAALDCGQPADEPLPAQENVVRGEQEALPWERGRDAETIEAELRAFCRAGELVYAAVVARQGAVEHSVCTVGSRPHNETEIGNLVAEFFAAARSLGGEVGEKEPRGLNLQGSRWSYSLDPLGDDRLLFGIFSSKALPGIVRACAQKTCSALESTPDDSKPG